MPQMHANEISLTVDQVKRIVGEQFPHWQDLDVTPVRGSGTVNGIFRLGDQLSARFPLVIDDPGERLDDLGIEADAEREILGQTHFSTPEPMALGRASPDYPGPWAVQTWLPGTPAIDVNLCSSTAFARDIAQLINDIRALPVRGRSFRGYGRGGDLRFAEEWIERCFRESEGLLDVPRLRRLWSELQELPRTDTDVMTHGDVLPTNLLVDDETLVGVLDVGGLGPADPALDLMAAWNLFDHDRREFLRGALKCSDLEWARSRAWAFEQAMGTVWYYRDSNPAMSDMGRRALMRIIEGGQKN